MFFEPNSKIVIMGDSITDCGRAQPVGEGLFNAFGNGWVNLIVGQLGAACPERHLRVVNMGTSGNTVRDLKDRWQRDVFDQKPDYVAVMIGTNDVWRQFDLPLQPESHVYADEYESTLDALVAQTLPKVKGMILLTPFYMEPQRADAMRAAMDRYGDIVRRVAQKHSTLVVDTQAAFEPVLAHMHSAAIGWDRVHPNIVGHTVIAKAFLKAVGFED